MLQMKKRRSNEEDGLLCKPNVSISKEALRWIPKQKLRSGRPRNSWGRKTEMRGRRQTLAGLPNREGNGRDREKSWKTS